MINKKRLAIIGAGDLGQQLAHFAYMDSKLTPIGFFDDTFDIHEQIHQLPILGSINQISTLFKKNTFDCLLIGIGYKHMNARAELYERFAQNIPFAQLIHPSAIIDPTARIEQGVVIYPGCIIDHYTVINHNCLTNLGCIISHHSEIGAHSFLAPAVKIAGKCKIGSKNVLGIGTTMIDHIQTVNHVRTGGGTVVIKDLMKLGIYVGNPAKLIKDQ